MPIESGSATLRHEAGLPFLPVTKTFQQEVARAEWQAIVKAYYDLVASELLAQQRQRHGPDWGHSVGGRWWLNAMTRKVLMERYGRLR